MKNLQINLEMFEGPFDLLFKLIEKNKINIYDIPIATLTDQYIENIHKLENTDMDEMSEFVVMAATLLQIKSKMLLPKNEEQDEEEDPREELVQKLLEYKKIKKIAEILDEKYLKGGESLFKPADDQAEKQLRKKDAKKLDDLLDGIDLSLLYSVFEDVIKRKDLKIDKIRSGFNSVTKAIYRIDNKIQYLKDLLVLNKAVNINEVFEKSSCKAEVLVTFLAVLEIVKEKEVLIIQNQNFGEIILTRGGANGSFATKA